MLGLGLELDSVMMHTRLELQANVAHGPNDGRTQGHFGNKEISLVKHFTP